MPRSRSTAAGAVLLVSVDYSFGVAARGVTVAGLFQSGAQLGMVENLAVEDDPNVAALVAERLMSQREIDNAEAAMAERYKFIAKETAVVGTAVADGAGHPLERFRCALSGLSGRKTRDSAHSASI